MNKAKEEIELVDFMRTNVDMATSTPIHGISLNWPEMTVEVRRNSISIIKKYTEIVQKNIICTDACIYCLFFFLSSIETGIEHKRSQCT